MSAWILVIAGILVWLAGQRIPPPKNPASIRTGWLVSTLGAGVFAIGIFAGLRGPVSFGSVTFSSFSFAHAHEKSDLEAMRYARNNLRVSSHPAAGWRGASKTDLKCNVVNNGSRKLTSLTFSFVTTSHDTINIKVRGPYPANATKSVLVPLPDNVVRSYFQKGMNVTQISAASF